LHFGQPIPRISIFIFYFLLFKASMNQTTFHLLLP
jgi:hypothetical protein